MRESEGGGTTRTDLDGRFKTGKNADRGRLAGGTSNVRGGGGERTVGGCDAGRCVAAVRILVKCRQERYLRADSTCHLTVVSDTVQALRGRALRRRAVASSGHGRCSRGDRLRQEVGSDE